jgi:YD repeat-containing protein
MRSFDLEGTQAVATGQYGYDLAGRLVERTLHPGGDAETAAVAHDGYGPPLP